MWADALVSGAIAQLAIMPAKEWTDVQLAAMHKGMYEQAVVKARVRDYRGVHMKVRQRPFY